MKSNGVLKTIVVIVVTAAIMSMVGISVYSFVSKPKFYDKFMETGKKYFSDSMYQEAVLEFNKAIKVEKKSVEAWVYKGRGHIELKETDAGVDSLKTAQDLDKGNEELLKALVYILKDVSPLDAYDILMRYVQYVGENNISDEIKSMLETANSKPVLPSVNPPAGEYAKGFKAVLSTEEFKLGHIYYYSMDNSEPSKDKYQFRGFIEIQWNTPLKIIGIGPNGDQTEVMTVNYVINTEVYSELESIINESQSQYDSTSEGENVGNCLPGSKAAFGEAIASAKAVHDKEILTSAEAKAAHQALNDALYNFRQKIIVPTDRSQLSQAISNAESLISSAVEGSSVGNYRSGAKSALQNAINTAKAVMDNLIARQNDIDNATTNLNNAIASFNRKKITEIDKIISDAGATTGTVTVSLLWNTVDDIDLHVISPRGDEVSFRNKSSSISGGKLDVDRQVGTFVSNPVENIYWNSPPRGTYTVKVNMFTKRTNGTVPCRVRVVVNGEATIHNVNISSGTVNVCTFTY